MELNDICHGFKLLCKEKVVETDSDAFIFQHVKSGARLLYLANDDDNKVFSISFRTPPADDTGVAHIMEHSTLCGSRKFPLKEPFVELVKGSLNTFLNAMTYPDKTMYPVASLNDKDFHNLMDVYLDAVFYPAIYDKPEIMQQEGWHYEIESPEQPLNYSGVVYNEMKGALSSPDDLLENEIMRALFPDNTYAKESGGNPEFIPNLTYEKFIDFHKKYYSPANSYIYLYGNMDIEEQLKFIDGEYLSHFDIVEVDSAIPAQAGFSEMKKVNKKYPVGAEESTQNKTYLSYNTVIGDAGDMKTITAMSVLEMALLKSPAAPLRKALIDAELGLDVDADFEYSVLQPYLSITINGSEPDRAKKFMSVLKDTVNSLVENGIDHTLLEASLNLVEFRLREADFGTTPKGLIYNIVAMTNWLYDLSPLEPLRYEEVLKFLRQGIETGYYENLLKRCIYNTHSALIVMEPSQTMAGEMAAKSEAKLAEIKSNMSADEIQAIIASTAKLKKMQQTPDSPEALATIPLLKISDIKPETMVLPLEERELDGVKILFSDVNTQGIAYVNLYFDAAQLPQELLPYAYLLEDIIGVVDTDKHSYGDLANCVNMHTGGISFDLDNFADFTKPVDPDSNLSYMRVLSKAFQRKLPELCQLLGEIINGSLYEDKKRIKDLIQQIRASMEQDMLHSSMQVMFSRLGSFISPSGAYAEVGSSLSLYPFVKELTDNFDNNFTDLSQKLQQTARYLFKRQGMVVGVTMQAADYPLFQQEMDKLLATFSDKEYPVAEYKFEVKSQQEGLLSSSRVQYVGKGANLIKLGYDVPGYMRVMDIILKYEYFWIKVRVQGGAYGAMTRIGQDGDIMFASYRDPKLKNTVEVFDSTADFLANFDASDREMTKYIIGAISNIDKPYSPLQIGAGAQGMWLRGVTHEERQKRRDQILSTTPQDIRNLAPAIDAAMKANNLCVFGNEVVINECKDMFQKLTKVMD